MNKQSFNYFQVTLLDYKKWCSRNNKPWYDPRVRKEFFKKLWEGSLIKEKSGDINSFSNNTEESK